jgi:F-type H+-transporting ATPase subunit b
VDINATLIGQTIAMIVFVWFCMKFVWPPLMDMIEERQTQIADGLAAAEKGSRSLELAEVEKAKLLEDARGQAREIIDQANTRGGHIVVEARETADKERERILSLAQTEVDQEVNRARDQLRNEVATLAIVGAEKIISREIDPAVHKDLLDKLAAEI